ncbi:hypothetical protein Esti_000132 [Eimeria stiedai]
MHALLLEQGRRAVTPTNKSNFLVKLFLKTKAETLWESQSSSLLNGVPLNQVSSAGAPSSLKPWTSNSSWKALSNAGSVAPSVPCMKRAGCARVSQWLLFTRGMNVEVTAIGIRNREAWKNHSDTRRLLNIEWKFEGKKNVFAFDRECDAPGNAPPVVAKRFEWFILFAVLAGTQPSRGAPEDAGGMQRGDPFIQGTLKLEGKTYRAVCNCNQGLTEADQRLAEVVPMCNPSKVKIHQDKSAQGGLSASEVRRIWGQPADATFSNVSETHFACLDDRISAPSLYTPGGDLGEFALALTACGTAPNDATILQILNAHVGSLPDARKFYHCTDDEALEHMESYLGMEGLDMYSPDPPTQAEISKALDQPRNVGDVHFRSLMKNPGWYHVEKGGRGVPVAVMKAFFAILWDASNPNQQRLQLDVLAGKHGPQAFLVSLMTTVLIFVSARKRQHSQEIATTEDCEAANVAPLLRARSKQARALISHMNAVNARRKELAIFFTKNGFCSLSAEELASRMDRYGLTWLESTGLPASFSMPKKHLMQLTSRCPRSAARKRPAVLPRFFYLS